MSVMLTACRRSRQNAIERALKKKAEKKKERKAAKLAALVGQMGPPENTGPVKIWTFLLNGKPTSVVFHLDTLDVSLNGEELDADCQFTDAGSKTEFCLADHKAVIMTEVGQGRHDGQLTHSLYIDGNIVPE